MYWFEKSTQNIPVFHDDRSFNFRKVRHNSARIWGNNLGFKSRFFLIRTQFWKLLVQKIVKESHRPKQVYFAILSNIIKYHRAELAEDRAFLVCKTPLFTWNSCALRKGTTSALWLVVGLHFWDWISRLWSDILALVVNALRLQTLWGF